MAWVYKGLLNPNRSLDFVPGCCIFRAGCNVSVEGIAGYGETLTLQDAERDSDKGQKDGERLVFCRFRSNDRFGLK